MLVEARHLIEMREEDELPPSARGCWMPDAAADLAPENFVVLDVLSRRPLACGVLLGRLDVVAEG